MDIKMWFFFKMTACEEIAQSKSEDKRQWISLERTRRGNKQRFFTRKQNIYVGPIINRKQNKIVGNVQKIDVVHSFGFGFIFSFVFVLGMVFLSHIYFCFCFCFVSGVVAAPMPPSSRCIAMGESQPVRVGGEGQLLPSRGAISSQWPHSTIPLMRDIVAMWLLPVFSFPLALWLELSGLLLCCFGSPEPVCAAWGPGSNLTPARAMERTIIFKYLILAIHCWKNLKCLTPFISFSKELQT